MIFMYVHHISEIDGVYACHRNLHLHFKRDTDKHFSSRSTSEIYMHTKQKEKHIVDEIMTETCTMNEVGKGTLMVQKKKNGCRNDTVYMLEEREAA